MVIYRINLDVLDLGQVLDGLENRAKTWERTAEYLRSGNTEDEEALVLEECANAEEAERIAKHYQKIVRNIWMQVLLQAPGNHCATLTLR